MAEATWRKQKDGIAHLVLNNRSRCAVGFLQRGTIVQPPKTGDEHGYCYNCHFHSIFDTMPKTKTKILSKLMNREIGAKVKIEQDQIRANIESREKDLAFRVENVRKQEDEFRKTRESVEQDKKLVEVGKAFKVLATAIGDSIMDASMDFYKARRMGW